MIGGKFAPLTIMSSEDTDLDSMIAAFNTAVTETASEILGKHRQKKKTKKKTSNKKKQNKKKQLDHCRNSGSVRQNERTQKENI